MNIGDVSERSGLPVKTIRYYEDIGLVRPERGANGYRLFEEGHLQKLKFICRARSLGFSLEECRELMSLYEAREGGAAEARKIARHHICRAKRKIAELQSMTETLQHLIALCDQGDRPECPILNDLAQGRSSSENKEMSLSRYREEPAVDFPEMKA